MAPESKVVVWGVGQLGALFSTGFLKLGYPVFPVTRQSELDRLALNAPEPELVLVAVGEPQLPAVFARLPESWRRHVALLQNELVSEVWESAGLVEPTVCVVWLEKKQHGPTRWLKPSGVFGPRSELVCTALQALDIPATTLGVASELERELALKNLYILTINCVGLVVAGTIGEVWAAERELVKGVARDALSLQAHLFGGTLDDEGLMESLVELFAADPEHVTCGRSAPERLERALAQGVAAGLPLPTLMQIRSKV